MIDHQAVNSGSTQANERELVIERSFDAARELVWQAWTEPERLNMWWGPKGYQILVRTMDLRPHGVFLYSIRVPDGPEMWGKFVYREIVPPERIVFISSFSDAAANITRNPMSATWPLEVLNSLTLEENGAQTTLTLRGGPHHANDVERTTFHDARVGILQGFAGTFAQLDAYLASLK
jgi:uncharacterized protein YndB with AHSA1/START domain